MRFWSRWHSLCNVVKYSEYRINGGVGIIGGGGWKWFDMAIIGGGVGIIGGGGCLEK